MVKRIYLLIIFTALFLIPTVSFAQRWDFHSSTEGWTGHNADVWQGDDFLYVDPWGSDPGTLSPSLSLNASSFGLVRMHMSSNCPDTNGRIYFKTSSSPSFDEAKSVPFSVTCGSGWCTYEVDMTVNASWTGTITGIRIDPANNGIDSGQTDLVGFDWIEITSVTLPPPTLLIPSNGGDLTGPPYVFNWSSVAGAGAYQLKVSTDPTFTTTIINDQNISGSVTSYTYSGSLTWGITHYWQMRTLNSSGTQWGNWSAVWSFTPEQSTLPPPTLTSPIGGATVDVATDPGTVPLRWSSVSGNSGYKLQIDTLPIMDISINQYDATLGIGYHEWKVCTKNASEICGAWSVTETFTVQLISGPPDLTSSASVGCKYTSGQINVQIPVTVHRSGGSLTSGTYVHAKLYWSTNDTQDAGDTVLWSSNDSTPDFPNSVLNSNGSKTVTATVNIPAIPSGTYYIISYADAPQPPNYPNGFHTEIDETNNATAYQVTIPEANQPPSLVPLYRLYKHTDRDHFYTTCENEKDNALVRYGYNYEKIEAYIYDLPFQDVVPLYRLYNPSITGHYYTTSETERQNAKNQGYKDEGIAGYVYPVPHEYTVPMFHLEGPDTDHFYTISEFERDNAVTKYGYFNWGVAFYVARNSMSAPLAGKPTAKQSGIDMASGNFQPYYNHVDFANLPGKGIPFIFTRTYNAMNAGDSGPLGPGWNHSYNIRIVEDTANGIAIVKWGDGRDDYYTINGSSYEPYTGIYDNLTKSGTTFILTKKDLTKYTFEIYSPGLGRLTRIEDRNGNPVVLIYDSDGNLNTVREGEGITDRSYSFTYIDLISSYPGIALTDSNRFRLVDFIEQDASLNFRNIRFGYDEKGNLVKYWDAENNLTQYEYNEDNLLEKIILPRGNTWKAEYDNTNKIGKIKGYTIGREIEGQSPIEFQRASIAYGQTDGTVITVATNPGNGFPGKRDSCNHNLSNFTVTSCKDSASTPQSEVLEYDANLNPKRIKDMNGYEWNYAYNTKGNVLTATTPLNETTTYEYDPTGLLQTKVTDPEGNITRYEYDANGNLWKIINVDVINGTPYDRVTTIIRYNASDHPEWNGLAKSVTDPRNNTTNYEYDSRGYLAKITDSFGKITQFTHDAGGRLTNKTDADGVSISYTYDSMNRIKTVTDHQGRITNYDYDANGNLINIIDPRNIKKEFIYRTDSDLLDTVNNINLFTQANTMIVKRDYDPLGRLTKVTNAKNYTWQNTYDEVGNIESEKTPLGYEDLYQSHDFNGNLTRFKDRTGRIIDYTYDYSNRLKTQVVPGSQYSFDYLKNGLLHSASFPNQSSISSFDYTTRSQIKSYTDPFGKSVDYTYDEAGNLKTITFNGKTVTYNYDQRNLLESVTDWLSQTTWYTYTDAGRISRITYPNGTYMEYIYDPSNPARLQILNNKKSDGTLIVGYAVGTFDALDAPEQITTSGGIEPVSQSYDSGTIDFDANNRIMNTGFSYNNQGEIQTKTMRGVTTNFVWDSNDMPGRLKSISSNGSTTNYVYDALGNRIEVTKGGVTTRYVLDVSGEMSNVIAETDASGNVKAYYVYGLGLISKILLDNTAKYYHYDMIGNTVALTDDSGNVTDQYAYSIDPYGFSVTSQGSTENPFKFVGRYGVMDDGNSIFYMRARYYDAETGRFLNEDPLGFEAGGWNLYAYVEDNPIVDIDPEGLINWNRMKITRSIKKLGEAILGAVGNISGTKIDSLEIMHSELIKGLGKGPDFISRLRIDESVKALKITSGIADAYQILKGGLMTLDIIQGARHTKPLEALETAAGLAGMGIALVGAPEIGALVGMSVGTVKMEAEACRSLEYLLRGQFKCPNFIKNIR